MNLKSVLVIVRHNTQLGGDLRLAQREFDALLGRSGETIANREDLAKCLSSTWGADVVELSKNTTMVACRYVDAPIEAVTRLLRRSAFAQEVFIVEPCDKIRALFLRECLMPCHEVVELWGGRFMVALSQAYIIESEAVFDSKVMSGRLAATIELLLQPYTERQLRSAATRIRQAKKTTLSLSHDLHIYKAKFFPRMVRALLNIFAPDDATVFDPYCGSGTALLEASLLGMNSYGIDLDPICQLISKTKVTPFVREASLPEALHQFEKRLNQVNGERSDFVFPAELKTKIERRDRMNQTTFLQEISDQASCLATALSGLRFDNSEEDLVFTLASDAVTKKVRYRFVGIGNGRYTIEIVKQTLLERLREKITRSQQLAGVFNEIAAQLNTKFGNVFVSRGDARNWRSWPLPNDVDVILTSPPYLPASSGREHYASSRALAFSILGYQPGEDGYFDMAVGNGSHEFEIGKFPEAARLLHYLESDATADVDPQRDAMRFERKAGPTRQYLADILLFFKNAVQSLSLNGVLLLVVAHHHTFYSHRRQELEHIVSGRDLYAEIAADAGFEFIEEIEMKLMKSSTSRARPMAKQDYYESVLVFRPGQSVKTAQ